MKKIQIQELYDLFLRHPNVSTDSRMIQEGDLFFALKGENFDGNTYALDAIHNGASFSIVDDESFEDHLQVLHTDDVLKTLQDLSLFHRQHFNIPVIGITGTNGKTTTKELVHAVLSKKFNTYATKGNLNNHIGVPLSILAINESHEIAVIEMGANHIGEIEFLCQLAQPDFGLITNIGKAHIEGFGSIDGIIKAKTELYKYLEFDQGLAFVNIADDLLIQLSGSLRKFTYGPDKQANCNTQLKASYPVLQVEWKQKGIDFSINSNLYGSYNFQNINAAISIGDHFTVDPNDIVSSIEAYMPDNNRSQLIQTSRNILYMDAYNANPSSMELAINNFNTLPESRKVLILGDMMELGNASPEEHQKVIELANSIPSEAVIFIGNYFQDLLGDKEMVFANVQEAKKWLSENPYDACSILIKGSRKVELEKLLDVL